MKKLEAKAGKSLDAWVAMARSAGIDKHGQLVAHLKQKHGLTHGYANQIALRALKANDAPAAGSDDLIEAQYSDAKAALRPVYEALIQAVRGFGTDVEVAPQKAYASLRRSK